jgi:GNAT superfamily N-acetyltransferase
MLAFFSFGYDFGKGRFLYLEDLFIEKLYRGNGGGSLIIATLTSVANSVGCAYGRLWTEIR